MQNADGGNSFWVAVGTVASMLAGAILKTFVDLVGRKDKMQEKWREDMLKDQADLRAWNQRQQAAIERLEHEAKEEITLRHQLRGELLAEQNKVHHLELDKINLQQKLDAAQNEIKALHEKLGAQSAPALKVQT